jgi:hypothetical protein
MPEQAAITKLNASMNSSSAAEMDELENDDGSDSEDDSEFSEPGDMSDE